MPQLSGLGSDNREQAYKRIPSGTAKYGIKICFLLICFQGTNGTSAHIWSGGAIALGYS